MVASPEAGKMWSKLRTEETVVHFQLCEAEMNRDVRLRQFKKNRSGDIPDGPVVKTLNFHCRGCGFHPWLGN